MSIVFEEKHLGRGIVQTIGKSKERPNCWVKSVKDDGAKLSSINQMFKEIFLPRGYPDSVSSDYLSYQIWDSLQAFGSSITGTLATHNMLKGFGVGDQSASVMSATFTWLLKGINKSSSDGTGMIGRIAFTYLKGSNLDVDCKKWRLFADIINDFAIGLDMICPIFSNDLLIVQCTSGFIKSLVGTIGGATRAALTQHQARNNNLADVSAKDASQETLVNLAALLTSLIIVPLIVESNLFMWILFMFLTLFHIYCNYRAVKSVKMETFNPSRWSKFTEQYIFHLTTGTIDEINQLENIWFFAFDQIQERITSGLPLSHHNLSDEQLTELTRNFSNQEYIISVDGQQNVLISFIEGQDSVRNKMKSYFHGNLILLMLSDPSRVEPLRIATSSNNQPSISEVIVASAKSIVDNKFDQMMNDAQVKGWNLSNFIFLENGWRVTINDSNKKSN